MRKIKLSFIMLCILFLAACGNSTTTSTTGDSNKPAGDKPKTEKKAEKTEKPIQMILTNELAVKSGKNKSMEQFIALVEEKSNGRIKGELYPTATLYSDADAVAALGSGSVHVVWPATGWFESLNQAVGIMRLPFALNDKLMLNDPEYRKNINEFITGTLVGKNIKVLGQLRSTEYLLYTKKLIVENVDDFKGKKIRVSGGEALIKTLDALGATAISMPSSEASSALAQGTIDGVLSSPNTWANKAGDLAKGGLIMPSFLMSTYTMAADESWFNNLPEDLQKVIIESADEVANNQWQGSIDEDTVNFGKIEEFAKFVTFNQTELDKLSVKVAPVYEFYKNKFPEDFAAFVEIQKSAGLDWPKK